MKKLLLSFFSLLMLGLLTPSCSNEKEMDIKNPNDTAELSFEVNLLGNPNQQTKASSTEIGKCATQQELETQAGTGSLILNVTINDDVYTPKIRWTGSKFIADPILLGEGDYSVTAATVTNGSNEVLFSAVNSQSSYAGYIPEILPKKIKVGGPGGNIPLYQKTALDLYVMCVLKETPEDFGFVKWNVHFTKVYCVPFIINMCKDNEHFIAGGSLNIKNGTYINEVFTPVTDNETGVKWAKINKTVTFTDIPNALEEICFADNYEIPNESEWYQFTLNITSPIAQTIVGYANISTLIKYNDKSINNAWNSSSNMIHFDFCDGNTWFFISDPIFIDPCSSAITSLDVRFNSISDAADAGLESYIVTEWDDNKTVPINGSWVKGIPKDSVTIKSNTVFTKKGLDQIRTPLIKLDKDIRISLMCGGDQYRAVIMLVSQDGKEYRTRVSHVNGYYSQLKDFCGTSSTDIPEEGCYRIVIRTKGTASFGDFRIQPPCPTIISFLETFNYKSIEETREYCRKWYTLHASGISLHDFAPGLWGNTLTLEVDKNNTENKVLCFDTNSSSSIATTLCKITTSQTISFDQSTNNKEKTKLFNISLYDEDRKFILGKSYTTANTSYYSLTLNDFDITSSGNYHIEFKPAWDYPHDGYIYIDNIKIE